MAAAASPEVAKVAALIIGLAFLWAYNGSQTFRSLTRNCIGTLWENFHNVTGRIEELKKQREQEERYLR